MTGTSSSGVQSRRGSGISSHSAEELPKPDAVAETVLESELHLPLESLAASGISAGLLSSERAVGAGTLEHGTCSDRLLPRAQSAVRVRPSAVARERARSADPRRARRDSQDLGAPEDFAAYAERDVPAVGIACGGEAARPATARARSQLAALAANANICRKAAPFRSLLSSIFGGKYNVGRFLGRGASASVWEATLGESSTAQSRFAVKVFDQGSKDRRQALREMRILSRVKHPRIVEAFEVVETSVHSQLVCELVDGESFRAFAQRQPQHRVSEDIARCLYQQVLDGVRHCHACFVVHRDLKLDNLLLGCTDGVKIIDFGFAAQVASRDAKLKAFCGTPSYMAPEIVRGEGYSGFATDVWALGVVVFALLAGSLPFAGRTELQLYAKIRRGAFTAPDYLGEAARRLVRGILRPDASSRPSVASLTGHPWLTHVGGEEASDTYHRSLERCECIGGPGTQHPHIGHAAPCIAPGHLGGS